VDLRPELGERMGACGSESSAARERLDLRTASTPRRRPPTWPIPRQRPAAA
jgi:hypothetical protein